jgi:hypothetical protein
MVLVASISEHTLELELKIHAQTLIKGLKSNVGQKTATLRASILPKTLGHEEI